MCYTSCIMCLSDVMYCRYGEVEHCVCDVSWTWWLPLAARKSQRRKMMDITSHVYANRAQDLNVVCDDLYQKIARKLKFKLAFY